MSLLETLLVLLAVLLLAGGTYGDSGTGWGLKSFSPLGQFVLLLIVVLLVGAL